MGMALMEENLLPTLWDSALLSGERCVSRLIFPIYEALCSDSYEALNIPTG